MAAKQAPLFRKIPSGKLFVSEPNPRMFGNGNNEHPGNKKWTNSNWLKSRFHFSFAEYNSHHNSNFGVLRVLNDDLVQPARGFGTHGHANMEICTYIVDGGLTHQDSMGSEGTLRRGGIQFMSSGSGVRHSEQNKDADKDLRFLQMWLVPRENGKPPKYGQMEGDLDARLNQWAHLVSDGNSGKRGPSTGGEAVKTPVKINTDANIFATELKGAKSDKAPPAVVFELKEGRQAYLMCVEGSVTVTGGHGREETMVRHDAAEVYGPNTFTVTATGPVQGDKPDGPDAHLVMIEMVYTGEGRTDL